MTPWTTPCYLLNKLGNDTCTYARLTLPIINYVTTRFRTELRAVSILLENQCERVNASVARAEKKLQAARCVHYRIIGRALVFSSKRETARSLVAYQRVHE